MVIIGQNVTIKSADIVAETKKIEIESEKFHTVIVNERIIFQSAHEEYAQDVYDKLVSAMKAKEDVFEV